MGRKRIKRTGVKEVPLTPEMVEIIERQLKEEPMSEEEVLGMIVNPIYAGVGPYPQIVPDAKWIAAVGKAIEEVGAEQVLRTMLEVLRQAWAAADTEKERDTSI